MTSRHTSVSTIYDTYEPENVPKFLPSEILAEIRSQKPPAMESMSHGKTCLSTGQITMLRSEKWIPTGGIRMGVMERQSELDMELDKNKHYSQIQDTGLPTIGKDIQQGETLNGKIISARKHNGAVRPPTAMELDAIIAHGTSHVLRPKEIVTSATTNIRGQMEDSLVLTFEKVD